MIATRVIGIYVFTIIFMRIPGWQSRREVDQRVVVSSSHLIQQRILSSGISRCIPVEVDSTDGDQD